MIPNLRKPGVYTEANTSTALRGLVSTPTRVLLIGQKLSSGSAAANTPVRVNSVDQGKSLFAPGSQLAHMTAAFMLNSVSAELWAVAMSEPEGDKALGSLTFTASSMKAGQLQVRIGAVEASVKLEAGMTSAQVATAVATGLGASKQPNLPVNAQVDGSISTKVNLESRQEGVIGNELEIAVLGTPPGLSVTVVQCTGGAGDADLTAALEAAFAAPFHLLVLGVTDADQLDEVKTHLESVSSATEQRMSIGVVGFTGTTDDAITLAELNSERMTLALLRGSESPFWNVAAAYAGVIAERTDPSLPMNGDPVLGLHVPELSDWLSRSEQETLLFAGVTPLEVTTSGTVEVVRAITTRTTTNGEADPTLLDLTTMQTLDELRRQWKARISRVFGAGAAPSNRKLTAQTLERIKAETLVVLRAMESAEQLRNIDAYADQVEVAESTTVTGRVDCQIPAPVVPGLHVIAATFNLSL